MNPQEPPDKNSPEKCQDESGEKSKEKLASPSKAPSNLIALNDSKAGMVGLDKEKINQIIYEASKDSPFYKRQMERQKKIDVEIEEKVKLMNKLTPDEIAFANDAMDVRAATLDLDRRNLSRIIVHLDMDMFYAAVEIRDDPSLAEKPMAVGSFSMISTSNYIARKFGVRAAMAGFIGKKLCKDLVIIPPNFNKYRATSKEVMDIIAEYDPHRRAASLDEAYFDLTDYVLNLYEQKQKDDDSLEPLAHDSLTLPKSVWDLAADVVNEIRSRIHEKTKLTASAGIAHNTMFAKICSDINKPNGQFIMDSTNIEAVEEFLFKTPVRKIPGIGPVAEQHLKGIGVDTCGDLKDMRGVISLLFTPASVDFYLRVSLGIASNYVSSDDDHVRKSLGAETTFKPTNDMTVLVKHLTDLSQEVSSSLKERNLIGKTVTLVIKWASFVDNQRGRTLKEPTNDADVILTTVKSALEGEMQKKTDKPNNIRLVGVRVSNFVENEKDEASSPKKSKKQTTLTEFVKKSPVKGVKSQESQSFTEEPVASSSSSQPQKWFEFLCTECMKEFETEESLEKHVKRGCPSLKDTSASTSSWKKASPKKSFFKKSSSSSSLKEVKCPICYSKFNGLNSLNEHLDAGCLKM